MGEHLPALENPVLSVFLRLEIFHQSILSVMKYGAETTTLIKKSINKVRTTQTATEKSMLEISLRGREIRRDVGQKLQMQ